MPVTIDALSLAFKRDITSEVERVKDSWTPEERLACDQATRRMVDLMLREKCGEDVKENVMILKATIQNWKVAGMSELATAFENGAKKALTLLGVFAGAAIRTLV